MRVSKEQAAENREKVVEAASRLFRERGLSGVSIGEIMAEAGLTHGGFYGQFASKDELEAEACARTLSRSAARWRTRMRESGGAPGVIVEDYLAASHIKGMRKGCALPALAEQVGRSDNGALREAFTEGFEALAGALSADGRACDRETALAQLASMVGAIVLARAVDDRGVAREILAAVKRDVDAALATD